MMGIGESVGFQWALSLPTLCSRISITQRVSSDVLESRLKAINIVFRDIDMIQYFLLSCIGDPTPILLPPLSVGK